MGSVHRSTRRTVAAVCVTAVAAGIALIAHGCAAGPRPGEPVAQAPRLVAPSKWSYSVVSAAGAFDWYRGTRFSVTYEGAKTWKGRQAQAFALPSTTIYVDERFRPVAWATGSHADETWEPYWPIVEFPLFVGKRWVAYYHYTNNRIGRRFDNVRVGMEVEAFDTVRTPAGEFKTFKVTHSDPGWYQTIWWSPDVEMFVKFVAERPAGAHAPPGRVEMELISYKLGP